MDLFFSYRYYEILAVLGTFGNLATFLIFSRKRFNKIKISLLFRIMTVLNSFTLWTYTLMYDLNLNNLTFLDNFLCKFSQYFTYMLPTASGWILLYASLIRYITIRSFKKIRVLESSQFNIAMAVFIILATAALFLPINLYFGMVQLSSENSTNGSATSFRCLAINTESNLLISLVTVVFSFILPFSSSIIACQQAIRAALWTIEYSGNNSL